MSNARRIIRRTAAITALAGTLGAGAVMAAEAAAPAASGPVQAVLMDNPTSSANATVTVTQSINFAFTSSPSFALAPGQLSHSAVAFQISTNDSHGFALDMSAPDPQTGGGLSFPAHDLAYASFQGGSEVDSGTQQLSNTAALAFSQSGSTNGTDFTQDWTANLPANTAPGAYVTQITYTAIGQ